MQSTYLLAKAVGTMHENGSERFTLSSVFQFTKRLDPDSPFYYHTCTHSSYSEGPLKALFDEQPKREGSHAPWCELSSTALFSVDVLPY